MSIRNVRKLYGDNTLPPPEGNSDEEYEPLYAKRSPTKYKYQGLALSSHSESEHESTDAVGVENAASCELAKKKKKKKKKQRKVKQLARSSSKENLEMDEIDKAVMEVKALLGSPPSMTAEKSVAVDLVHELLAVQQKHLNSANELKRMFGPEPLDPANRRRGRQPNLSRMLKKAVIVPISDNIVNFKKFGLSMSVNSRDVGYTYFTFDHSKEYQRIHRAFLQIYNFRTSNLAMRIKEAQKNMHVEALLEGADSMFLLEEYTAANTLIEQAISYMQYVAHPSFNLTNKGIRLEYKYLENRPFHIAVLKYLHLLTNRACHRTALELAKLLLILDPSDPLAVLLIIDTLALRAREHLWLIDAIDYWSTERDAGYLFNMQYSYAMAHFHVAIKTKVDLTKADNLLQKAMTNFPAVVLKILECANVTPDPRLKTHAVFTTVAERALPKDLKDLIFLYAKFSWARWREPAVMEWLLRNAKEFVDKFDADSQLRSEVKRKQYEHRGLFSGLPEEMIRYLSVIKPMANLLVDGAVPRVPRARACNPEPRVEGVNRYGYELKFAAPPGVTNSALYELFSSLLPNYGATPHDLQRLAEMEHQRQVMALAGLPEGLNNGEVEPGAEAEAEDETDTLTDEEAAPAGDEHEPADGESHAEPNNFAVSIGALTDAVRRFVDVFEAGVDPEAINQVDQQPAEAQEDDGVNRQNDNGPNERPNDRPNEH